MEHIEDVKNIVISYLKRMETPSNNRNWIRGDWIISGLINENAVRYAALAFSVGGRNLDDLCEMLLSKVLDTLVKDGLIERKENKSPYMRLAAHIYDYRSLGVLDAIANA